MSDYVPSAEVLATQGGNPIAVAPPVLAVQKRTTPWAANQFYPLGSTVTPGIVVGPTATESMSRMFVCIVPGLSGATPPNWNEFPGTLTFDYQATWLNGGWFLG